MKSLVVRVGRNSILVCNLLLLGWGGTPFWSAHWTLLASRTVVTRQWRNAILVCALDVVCFAVFCCSAGAYRHSTLRIGCCCSCELLLLGRGVSPFWFAHWMLFASRLLLPGGGHIAILLCALDVVALANCCYSAGAEQHFGLRIGHYSLRELL